MFLPIGIVVCIESVGKALGGSRHRGVLGVGEDEGGGAVEVGLYGACLVHVPVVGQVERGTTAGQGLGRLQVEQVGIGIAVEEVTVLTDVVVVAGSFNDIQPANGVGLALDSLEHALQVALALLVAGRREVHGTQAVLGRRFLHALIDQVAVGAVAEGVSAVNHSDERCRAGLRLVRVGLVDGVALLGTRSQ